MSGDEDLRKPQVFRLDDERLVPLLPHTRLDRHPVPDWRQAHMSGDEDIRTTQGVPPRDERLVPLLPHILLDRAIQFLIGDKLT